MYRERSGKLTKMHCLPTTFTWRPLQGNASDLHFVKIKHLFIRFKSDILYYSEANVLEVRRVFGGIFCVPCTIRIKESKKPDFTFSIELRTKFI